MLITVLIVNDWNVFPGGLSSGAIAAIAIILGLICAIIVIVLIIIVICYIRSVHIYL